MPSLGHIELILAVLWMPCLLIHQPTRLIKLGSHCVHVRLSFSTHFSLHVRHIVYTESEFLSVFIFILSPQLPKLCFCIANKQTIKWNQTFFQFFMVGGMIEMDLMGIWQHWIEDWYGYWCSLNTASDFIIKWYLLEYGDWNWQRWTQCEWTFTYCGLKMPYRGIALKVNTGSCKGLLSGSKPLHEPLLTYHQWFPVTLTWEQFYKKYLNHQSLQLALKWPV